MNFKDWLAKEGNGHGGDRSSTFKGMKIGDVRAINPARDVLPFPPGPMQPGGSGKTAGKLNKPRSGIVGKMKKK